MAAKLSTLGVLGALAKLGPFASKDSWNRVKGVLDKLMTHLLLVLGGCDFVVDYYYYWIVCFFLYCYYFYQYHF